MRKEKNHQRKEREGMAKEVGNLQLPLQEKPRDTGRKPDVAVNSDKCERNVKEPRMKERLLW